MSIEKGQKLWLSKYALSSGIKEVVAAQQYDPGQYIRADGAWDIYKMDHEIHVTRAEAAKAAEAARIKKIDSLRKQIAKLEKLTFEVTA